MTPLVEIAIRMSVVLMAGLALHALLARRSAALRHLVLAIALAGAALVVPLSLVTPSWTLELPAIRQPGVEGARLAPASAPRAAAAAPGAPANVPSQSPSPASPPRPSRSIVSIVWAAGFAAGLAVLA